MGNEDRTINELYVPLNIKTRFEFFSGFGFTELLTTTVVTGVSIIIAYILFALSGEMNRSIIIVFLTMSGMAMAIRKNEYNQSITDIILLYFKFVFSQQQFEYEYVNPYMRGDKH